MFYSHVNYSVTKMVDSSVYKSYRFYSHVNYSVTKIDMDFNIINPSFTVT